MLFLITIVPSLHFSHFVSSLSLFISFEGQSGLMHTSWGCFRFLMTSIFGWEQWSHMLSIVLMKPLLGSLNVTLHSGYLAHAMNLPNLPLLSIRVPSLQATHFPTVFAFVSAVFVASNRLAPMSFSFFLNSASMSVSTSFASLSTVSCFFLPSMTSSISTSKCLVSSSLTTFGLYFSSVSIVFIPSSVAVTALSSMYPRW